MSSNPQSSGTATPAVPQAEGGMMFTFGDPEPVLSGGGLLDYLQTVQVGNYYEPPISQHGLARLLKSSPHHASAIHCKVNILQAYFRPHRLLSREAFVRYALDFGVFGNAYLERVRSIGGRPIALRPSLAKYTRRGVEEGRFFFLHDLKGEHEFARGDVFHLAEADVDQEIYGVPQYLSAMHAMLLNESATLFRRKYYLNGSHMGYFLYINDAQLDPEVAEKIKTSMREAKGPGNFRNMFLHLPNGKKESVQVIPVAEAATKDEFGWVKNCSRDDVLAVHRVPPQLMGIVPTNSGGFGDIEDAARVFRAHELVPLQQRLAAVNEWVGEEVVRFEAYDVAAPATSRR